MPNESNLPAGQPAHGSAGDTGYEVRDTNVRAVVVFLVSLSLFVVVCQVFLWGLLRGLSPIDPEPSPVLATESMEAIPVQLRRLHQAEDAALSGKGGPGALSIDAAINKLAEEGIPPGKAGLTEADMNGHSGMAAPEPGKKK